MKFSLFALLVGLLFAVPAHAEFTSIPDASIGYAEGNQAGNVVLTLNGVSEAAAFGLQMDELSGRLIGSGRVDYDGNGVSVHESAAQFSVRIEAFEPPASCVTPVSSPAFAAHIEVRDSGGNLILVAGAPLRSDAAPCPTWQLRAVVGHNLPATLALLKARYRDSAVRPSSVKTWGSVKGDYIRTVSGRYVKATI